MLPLAKKQPPESAGGLKNVSAFAMEKIAP